MIMNSDDNDVKKMNVQPMGENQVLLVPTPGLWPKDSYLADDNYEGDGDDHDSLWCKYLLWGGMRVM